MTTSPVLDTVFGPVSPPTAFEETVARLSTAIRLGLLPAGSQLPPERALAEQLGISRSTLREAITALVESDLLTSVRGRGGGTFVTERPPLSGGTTGLVWEQAREVLDHRVAVEAGAVLLAAERAGEEDHARLDELVAQMYEPQEFDDYRRADIRFHIALAEASGSQRLVAQMTEVQGELSELIALIPHPETVLTRSNDQHRRLVALLRRRDAERAATLIRAHLAGTERLLEVLR